MNSIYSLQSVVTQFRASNTCITLTAYEYRMISVAESVTCIIDDKITYNALNKEIYNVALNTRYSDG